jgi:hypothetical protein
MTPRCSYVCTNDNHHDYHGDGRDDNGATTNGASDNHGRGGNVSICQKLQLVKRLGKQWFGLVGMAALMIVGDMDNAYTCRAHDQTCQDGENDQCMGEDIRWLSLLLTKVGKVVKRMEGDPVWETGIRKLYLQTL